MHTLKVSFLLRAVAGCLIVIGCLSANVFGVARTRAQAIAIVRTTINRNASGCRISKIIGITAIQVKSGWRVTAKVVMSAGGTSRNETLVWTVTSNDAVPASELASEVERGCR
jgi:hypothetical protein